MSRRLPPTVGLVAFLMGLPLPAAAQIYMWRDARGTLVLSDRRLDPSVKTFEVSRSSIRAIQPPAHSDGHRYDDLIARFTGQHGVRADLVRAVIQVESGFDPLARSPKGAMGLMQLMPATATDLGVARPFDPAENIRGGVEYLRMLLDRFGSEELALAAYNAGPQAVNRYGNRVPPYRETKEYLRRVRDRISLRNGPRAQTIYRTSEAINGRAVPLYSNVKPSVGE